MARWDENTPLDRAIPFAAKAHAGLTDRTGKEGQICHVLRVEKNAHKLTNDERAWVIALLHDTVEDTQVTLEDIQKEFGEEIMEGVKSVTRGFRVRGEDRPETGKESRHGRERRHGDDFVRGGGAAACERGSKGGERRHDN